MKLITIAIAFCIMASLSFADEETLLNSDIEIGYFAGPVMKLTQFNGESEVLSGGRGGLIFNRSFIIGLGGYGMMSGFHMPMHRGGHGSHGDHFNNDHGNRLRYGGLEFEYIRNSNKLLHYSLSALLGAGSTGVDEHPYDENGDIEHDHDSDTDFVFEPSVTGMININQWFRLGIGLSYLFSSGMNTSEVDSADFGGPAATLMLKFGRFSGH